MPKVKSQHYIPQLLLRNFANYKGILSCYRIQDKKSFFAKPNSIMAENKLYDKISIEDAKKVLTYLDKNYINKKYDRLKLKMDNDSQFIEHSLASSESRFGVFINKLVNSKKGTILLNLNNRINLLLMLRQLSSRSVRRKQQIKSIEQEEYNDVFTSCGIKKNTFNNYESVLRFLDIFMPSIPEKNEINYIAVCGSISLAINDTDIPLLFGDNSPILKIPNTGEQLFPISPNLGILIRKNEEKSLIFKNKVDKYNNYHLTSREVSISNSLQSSNINNIVVGPIRIIERSRKHQTNY